jgi:hypothetical protein
MSEILNRAVDALSEAEHKLQNLMETAVAQHQYSDLSALAPVADLLLDVIGVARGHNGSPAAASPGPAAPPNPPPRDNMSAGVPILARSRTYPRFERQGDRLIKFAWSKKEHREYEHRVSGPVLLRLAEVFAADVGMGTLFLMDDLMPFKMQNGDEIPSYQAYLALAWFRSLGLIGSRGKDGYAVTVPDVSRRVEQAWNEMPDTLRR